MLHYSQPVWPLSAHYVLSACKGLQALSPLPPGPALGWGFRKHFYPQTHTTQTYSLMPMKPVFFVGPKIGQVLKFPWQMVNLQHKKNHTSQQMESKRCSTARSANWQVMWKRVGVQTGPRVATQAAAMLKKKGGMETECLKRKKVDEQLQFCVKSARSLSPGRGITAYHPEGLQGS